MTDEQIKQNAKNYVDSLRDDRDMGKYDYNDMEKSYIKGAHSRDEEVKELKRKNIEYFQSMEYWQKRARRLNIRRTKQGEKTKELRNELDQLSNPWISVTKQLPDDGEKVIIAVRWPHGKILYDSDVYYEDTGWEGYLDDAVIAWMQIPQIKKGE